MPVERVHPREALPAAFAEVRADAEVQLLMPLAVVLPCEALATPRPLALIRLLLRVRSQVACAWPPGGTDAMTQGEGGTKETEGNTKRG